MKKLFLLHVLLTAIGCALLQAATIKLGNDGQIDIDIPATWKSTATGSMADGGVTYEISLSPDDGAKLFCKIILYADPDFNQFTKKILNDVIQRSGDAKAPTSIEKKATLVPMEIYNGFGAYYVLTDSKLAGKTTGPDEYKVTAQFSMKYGKNLLATAYLSVDDAGGAEFQNMKKAITGMRPVLNLPGPTPKIKITKVKQGTQISSAAGPRKLIMPSASLRDFSSVKPKSNPGDFYFMDYKETVLILGRIEPANTFRYSNAREFWDSDDANKSTKGAPPPLRTNEEYLKIGEWDVYLYDEPPSQKPQAASEPHLRANFVDGKIWIEVQLSSILKNPGKTAREALVAYLKAFIITDATPAK